MKCKRQKEWGTATLHLYHEWSKDHNLSTSPCNGKVKTFWNCIFCSYRRSILKNLGVTENNHP